MEFGLIAVGLLAGAALAVSIRTAAYSARSLPQQLTEAVGECRIEVVDQRQALTGVEAKVASWRVEIENLLDQVDASLELTERKRRSMATSASKIATAEARAAEQVSPLTQRQTLEAEARRQGLI